MDLPAFSALLMVKQRWICITIYTCLFSFCIYECLELWPVLWSVVTNLYPIQVFFSNSFTHSFYYSNSFRLVWIHKEPSFLFFALVSKNVKKLLDQLKEQEVIPPTRQSCVILSFGTNEFYVWFVLHDLYLYRVHIFKHSIFIGMSFK